MHTYTYPCVFFSLQMWAFLNTVAGLCVNIMNFVPSAWSVKLLDCLSTYLWSSASSMKNKIVFDRIYRYKVYKHMSSTSTSTAYWVTERTIPKFNIHKLNIIYFEQRGSCSIMQHKCLWQSASPKMIICYCPYGRGLLTNKFNCDKIMWCFLFNIGRNKAVRKLRHRYMVTSNHRIDLCGCYQVSMP